MNLKLIYVLEIFSFHGLNINKLKLMFLFNGTNLEQILLSEKSVLYLAIFSDEFKKNDRP